MDENNITPENLETCLRALRRGERLKRDLLALSQLNYSTIEEYHLALEKLLHESVWQSYSSLRELEELPSNNHKNRQEALQRIAEDFHTQNGELAAFSALYYRYLSGMDISVKEMSQAASVVPQQFRRRLNQGLALLSQKLLRMALEPEEATGTALADLPLPEFTALVGVQKYLDLLTQLFTAKDGPILVSLEGIGGIGKSALARAFIALPETVSKWPKIVWVSARQTMVAEDGGLSPILDSVRSLEDVTARLCDQLGMSALAVSPLDQRLDGLKAALAREKLLVVVDNLETVEEFLRLVPTLAKMAGLSRFLMTTRQTLREFPYVHTIPLVELDKKNAFSLLDLEMSRRGHHNPISKEDFAELYAVLGGHPLALKLVAAQLYLRPQSEILHAFRQAQGNMDHLYRYLYWQTWHALSGSARRLLLSFLPSDPDGEDIEFLQLMSNQTMEAFYAALKELDRFSLLEITGGTEFPLYRLHSLTITFLRTDILHFWTDNNENDQPDAG